MSKRVLTAMPTFSGDIPVEVMFNILSIKVPEGFSINFAYVKRVMVDIARNSITEGMLNTNYDYLFFVDDDTIPPMDALEKMLALDKDIVIPPVPARREGGEDRLCLFEDDMMKQLSEIKEDRPIGGGGMSCTLIKRKVLENVANTYGKPFQFETIDGVNWHEDINFCRRAKELGHEIWGIHNVRPSHLGSLSMYQYTDDGTQTYIMGS